jgi:hypothetical protein
MGDEHPDHDLDRPGPGERFSAWLDSEFNRLGVRPFPGTDREALRGCVRLVARFDRLVGDPIAAMDQDAAALDEKLRGVPDPGDDRRRASERLLAALRGGPAVVTRPPAGTIARPAGGRR